MSDKGFLKIQVTKGASRIPEVYFGRIIRVTKHFYVTKSHYAMGITGQSSGERERREVMWSKHDNLRYCDPKCPLTQSFQALKVVPASEVPANSLLF